MKHPPVIKETNTDARSFSFSQFRAQRHKKSFNIRPSDISTDWPLENELQSFLVFRLHVEMILSYDVMSSNFPS